MNSFRSTVHVILILSALMVTVSGQKRMERINNGPWGGDHIHMEVTAESATLEFDCAHGTIEGPLMIDREGRFTLKGTFSRERGGPVRRDETKSAEPAVYSGSVNGSSMTLKIKLSGQEDVVETFVLTHGKTGRIRKCK